jgi:Uri superfamily endonuclease
MAGSVADRFELLTPQPGTYAIFVPCDEQRVIQVGRLGRLELRPGLFIYVGSALGRGGLRARLRRHLRPKERLHWHIDYLLRVLRPLWIEWVCSERKLEHAWARRKPSSLSMGSEPPTVAARPI